MGLSNEATGLLLVTAAGMSTTFGAALVLFPRLANLTNRAFLAVSLSVSAGVMLYVSFVEIFTKSRDSFGESNVGGDGTEGTAYLYATLCFFGGMLLSMLLDKLVHCLDHGDSHHVHMKDAKRRFDVPQPEVDDIEAAGVGLAPPKVPSSSSSSSDTSDETDAKDDASVALEATDMGAIVTPLEASADAEPGVVTNNAEVAPSAAGAPNAPDSAPVTSQAVEPSSGTATVEIEMADTSRDAEGPAAPAPSTEVAPSTIVAEVPGSRRTTARDLLSDEFAHIHGYGHGHGHGPAHGHSHGAAAPHGSSQADLLKHSHDAKMLKRMGLLTALAIAIHNFPEGLATYVATLDDPSVGAALAVAIAIHNIPEGVCVAMPVYYASGSRLRGFLYAVLSGVSEPVGALIGWLVLKEDADPVIYGIMFGVVAGIMVHICIHELLPTALRYDPHNRFTTYGVLFGFFAMALSLVLFTI